MTHVYMPPTVDAVDAGDADSHEEMLGEYLGAVHDGRPMASPSQ